MLLPIEIFIEIYKHLGFFECIKLKRVNNKMLNNFSDYIINKSYHYRIPGLSVLRQDLDALNWLLKNDKIHAEVVRMDAIKLLRRKRRII